MARVLFVYPNKEGYPIIPISISLLSGILKHNGHQTELFDVTFMMQEKLDHIAREKTKFVKPVNVETYWGSGSSLDIGEEFVKKIIAFKPDLIAFSIVENNYGCARKLFEVAKKTTTVLILVGGLFPTVSPEYFLEDRNVDLICLGEGEQTVVEIARRIDERDNFIGVVNLITKGENGFSKGPVANFYTWEPLVYQDRALFDDRHLFKPFMGKMCRMGNFELSRGCPYGCTYCINAVMQKLFRNIGRYRREKPIKSLMDEIVFAVKKYQLDLVFFNDENFLQMDDERFKEFCREYEKISLPFFISTRADTLLEERKIKQLKDIGCATIGIGVESGNENIRKKILGKKVSDKILIQAFRNCNAVNLRTTAYIMIGLPFETEKNILETVEFCRRIKTDSVAVSIFAPYHGTKMREVCLKNGFIKDGYNEKISVNFKSILKMPQISEDRLEELYYQLHDLIYLNK
jgi:radical SAM superfamily enzyme YgiQ (UPF0313 family)